MVSDQVYGINMYTTHSRIVTCIKLGILAFLIILIDPEFGLFYSEGRLNAPLNTSSLILLYKQLIMHCLGIMEYV